MRVRIDDVILPSSDEKIKGKEIQKFKKHINWCYEADVPVTVSILCQDISAFPKAIDYIRFEATEGKMSVALHGWDHGPYGDRTLAEVCKHLDKSMTWFYHNLGQFPEQWVTPHGANNETMQTAAQKFGLTIEDTSPPVVDQKIADKLIRASKTIEPLEDSIVMVHWWNRGLQLYRICQLYKYKTAKLAIENSTLKEKDNKICWNGWS